MNKIYLGRMNDNNMGNGKTVSAVSDIIDSWIEDDSKTIFSNIKLIDVEYTEFTPENIGEVLETKNSIVLLDELHSIVHVNHKINEKCTKHSVPGLCYRLTEFFRQVRKNDIDTYSTCQTFADTQAQLRRVMNEQIVCEKYYLDSGVLRKCDAVNNCPKEHEHYIKQKLYRNYLFVKDLPTLNPSRYYQFYNSYEVVKGWVSYE